MTLESEANGTLSSFNLSTRIEMDDNFPTMEEYHLTLSRNIVLSVIILVINATSPPGVHISLGEPVHDCLYIVNFHLEGG